MPATKDPKAAALKAVEDQEKVVTRATGILERCRTNVQQTQTALANAEAEAATQERLLAYAQSHPLLQEMKDAPPEPVAPVEAAALEPEKTGSQPY